MIIDLNDKTIALADRLRQLFEEVRCDPIDYGPLVEEVRALAGTPDAAVLVEAHRAELRKHASTCAIHDKPAGLCDCGATPINVSRRVRFTLAAGDVAIIFTATGKEQIHMRLMDDEEVCPTGYLKAVQAAYLFRCPRALAMVDELIQRMNG